ncbi:autotransporter outer membrane beta-barrel domain-containing protein [Sutterella wadsworthensis]|uniref:autotransporter outer membrane beta-barrel domain-containing protein n=1 Tax=Sutterella wadsworthensis TaxID=40545 RepID=UPI0019D0449F|nr:autotransporter outer membrane beta-barrel domain-containing protein [Sutterella wadsworthensis]
MNKGTIKPLVLAISMALCSANAFADKVIEEGKFDPSATVTEDSTYTVANNAVTYKPTGTAGVAIAIDPNVTLTMANENSQMASFSSVLWAGTDASLTFMGGNLVLKKDDLHPSQGQTNVSWAHIFAQGASAPLRFENQHTTLSGSVPNAIRLNGKIDATFTHDLDINIDRSTGTIPGRVVNGVWLAAGSTLDLHGQSTVSVTAGSKDVALYGFTISDDSKVTANELTVELDGKKATTLNQQAVYGLNVLKGSFTATGPVKISIHNAPDQADSSGVDLTDDSKVKFTQLETTFSGIGGSSTYGISAAGSAQAKISESLTIANAAYALTGMGTASIDVQKDFVTTAGTTPTATTLWATNQASLKINSLGKGKVQFWGSTVINGNATLEMNVGSGNAAEDSYWSVSGESKVTKLSVASNAALNFLVTPDMVNNLTNKAIVTSKETVLLHSDSKIALAGTGFTLTEGSQIPLIYSDNGIALDILDDAHLLKAGTQLPDLKTDLTVERLKSQARIETNQLSKDKYDLLMDDDAKTLVAEFTDNPVPPTNPDPDPDKPNPDPDKPGTDPDQPSTNPDNPGTNPDNPGQPGTTERVNEQTDSLMQSSLAAASTLFAADELLIDFTIKSRQGVRQTGPFAAAKVGKYDLDVPGTADSTVISGLLGYAFNVQGSEVGGFMEMGHGTYDTKTADVGSPFGVAAGDGKHNYVGFGVYGNYATPVDWLHVTGYLKGGWLRSKYAVALGGVDEDFDRTSNYWGAHLGVYGEFAVADKFKNRTFLNYFYDGREGENYRSNAGVEYHLNSLNTHRAQVGSMFEYAYTPTLRPYAALTYEYAFKAEAKGKFTDQDGTMDLNATDLEGSTGIVSLGWTYQNEAKCFEFDVGVNGYVGKRQGVSAQAQAAWKF